MPAGIRLNACQWVAAGLGGALALAMVLYPPWRCRIRVPYRLHPAVRGSLPADSPMMSCERETTVYSWVFRPPRPSSAQQCTATLDWPVLALRLTVAACVALLAVGLLSSRGPVLRLVARFRSRRG